MQYAQHIHSPKLLLLGSQQQQYTYIRPKVLLFFIDSLHKSSLKSPFKLQIHVHIYLEFFIHADIFRVLSQKGGYNMWGDRTLTPFGRLCPTVPTKRASFLTQVPLAGCGETANDDRL